MNKPHDPTWPAYYNFAYYQDRFRADIARGRIRQADNSPGISEESFKKIMEQLFTTNSYGTGLGLPAVEKILVRHGDGLDVTSRPAQGAGFTAWFPLIQTQEWATRYEMTTFNTGPW